LPKRQEVRDKNHSAKATGRLVVFAEDMETKAKRGVRKPGGIMSASRIILYSALFLIVLAVGIQGIRAQDQKEEQNQTQDQNQLPANYVPSGEQIFRQYCAACHGPDAKGRGPARSALRGPAPDLTTLAKRHGGRFPYAYVAGVLEFGPAVAAHGSGNMPLWGDLFTLYYNKESSQRRIQNLCDYLATLQVK
jgi:mono/diheme cytochrome c family protein